MLTYRGGSAELWEGRHPVDITTDLTLLHTSYADGNDIIKSLIEGEQCCEFSSATINRLTGN